MKKYLNEISLKLTKTDLETSIIKCSEDAYKYIKQFYFDDIEIFESFFILLLNRQNKTIGFVKISQGGCTGTVVDNKIIAKYCIDSLADSVILAHNHPSGLTKPSQNDIDITKNLLELSKVLKLITCSIRDHIILANDNYFSFADEGLI